jgi:hypothetical protein
VRISRLSRRTYVAELLAILRRGAEGHLNVRADEGELAMLVGDEHRIRDTGESDYEHVHVLLVEVAGRAEFERLTLQVGELRSRAVGGSVFCGNSG